MVYEASYAELDDEGNYTKYFTEASPAYLRVEFKRLQGATNPPTITSVTLLPSAPIPLSPITDTAGVTLEDKVDAIGKYKTIEVKFTKARSSSMLQLLRFELFKGKTALLPREYIVTWNNTPVTILSASDPMSISNFATEAVWEASLPATLVITSAYADEKLDVDGFSFMTGADTTKQPLEWTVRGTANNVAWKTLTPDAATYSPYIYFRPPIFYFNSNTRINLPQNPNRNFNFEECLTITDAEIAQTAATLVYEEWSKNVPGYSQDEKVRAHAYLTNILKYRVSQEGAETVVILKPEITVISVYHEIYKMADDEKLPYIKLVMTFSNRCEMKMIAEKNTVSTEASLRTGTFIDFPGQLTNYYSDTALPFGWKGVPTVLDKKFTAVGNYRLTSDAEYKMGSYTQDGFGAVQTKDFGNTAAFALTKEGAASVCALVPDCAAFVATTGANGPYSGFFIGMPGPATRMEAVQQTTYAPLVPNGQPLQETSNILYVKKGYEIFRYIRLTVNKRRDGTAGTPIEVGKLKFYQGDAMVPLDKYITQLSAIQEISTANFGNLFKYDDPTLSATFSGAGASGKVGFNAPILANSYGLVTGPNSLEMDPLRWTLEVSLDGATWKTLDDKAKADQAVPLTRNAAFPITLFYPEFANVSIEAFTSAPPEEPQEPQRVRPQRRAGPVRFLRFTPLALQDENAATVQLSKLVFFNRGQVLPLKGAKVVTLDGTDRPVDRSGFPTAPALVDYARQTTYWSDSGMGIVVIALEAPTEIDAFTMITGEDADLAPTQWYLEGSTDAYNWYPLHEQAGYDATCPTAPFSQYLIYPFSESSSPWQQKNIFERSIADFKKSCSDADILQQVDSELAMQSPPVFFNPSSASFNGLTNTCVYYQEHDNTDLEVAFKTNLSGQTTIEQIKKKRAGAKPKRRTAPAIGPRPRLKPKLQPIYESPLDVPGFGSDRARNALPSDILDEVFVPPLEQEGSSAALSLTPLAPSSPTIKYIRFRPLKTRQPNAAAARIGLFSLWHGTSRLNISSAVASNPMGTWKGDIYDITEEGGPRAAGWEDRAKQALVLAFPTPIRATGFSWTVPAAATAAAAGDPVRWKLEASPNGVFWTTLHEQTRFDYETPIHPGWPLPIFMFDGSEPRPRPSSRS
jgi:hypothetical protein